MSDIAPGESARCGGCGEQVVVPEESERPLLRDRPSEWRRIRSAVRARRTRILAGLLPLATMGVTLAFTGIAGAQRTTDSEAAVVLFYSLMLLQIVANPLLGVIVGRNISRLRFVCGTGIAVAGWIAFATVFGSISEMIWGPMVYITPPWPGVRGQLATVSLMGCCLGLFTSPLAGIAGVVDHRMRKKPPGSSA